MKKLILFLAVIACTLSASAQDSLYINQKDGSIISYAIANVDSISFTRKASTVTGYVLINGVKWATRNVAAPGTFATNAYDAGDFYQWNSKVGWPSTGTVTGWNRSWTGGYTNPSSTDTWTSANDPSPAGYRVPTYAEIQTLLDTTKVTHTWTTQNSINGEKFTDKTTGNSLFLPALGYRYGDDGTLINVGSNGFCWSSTASSSFYAYYLYFYSNNGSLGSGDRAPGLSVRPVLE
jgi:uncharacterized protein (TIGR02145 family)